MCSFMYIIKSELPEVFVTISKSLGACPETQPWYFNGTILYLIILWLIVAPLASLRSIDFLSFTSTLAMIAMCIFTVIVTVYSFIIDCPFVSGVDAHANTTCLGYAHVASSNSADDWNSFLEGVEALKDVKTCPSPAGPSDWKKAILAVPMMVFAFMCQESIVTVYAQFKKDGGRGLDMLLVSKVALGFCLVLYWFIAFMSFKTWSTATISDMLLPYSYGYSDHIWVSIARLCSITCVIFSAPLLHYPCRRCLQFLIFKNDNFTWPRHLGLMLAIIGAVSVCVGIANNLQQIFTYGGIVSSGSLMIILPNLCYYILTNEKNLAKFKTENQENADFLDESRSSLEISRGRRLFSLGLGIFGLVFMVFAFALQILKDFGKL